MYSTGLRSLYVAIVTVHWAFGFVSRRYASVTVHWALCSVSRRYASALLALVFYDRFHDLQMPDHTLLGLSQRKCECGDCGVAPDAAARVQQRDEIVESFQIFVAESSS